MDVKYGLIISSDKEQRIWIIHINDKQTKETRSGLFLLCEILRQR